MRIPYIKFIETLVVERLTATALNKKLEDFGLAFPEQVLKTVHKHLKSINPDHFGHARPPADPEWLAELKIEKMYGYIFGYQLPAGTAGIKGAIDILNDPPMYRLVTSMALAKITDEDIELMVNGQYKTEYSDIDIVEFLHYFFNVKDWTFKDRQAYVKSVNREDLVRYYKLALKGDKDYLLWKLGAAPNKSYDDMIREMIVDSFYNFKDKAKYDHDVAQKWGTLTVKLTDKLDKIEKDTSDKKNLFEDIQFKLKDKRDKVEEIPHLAKIDNV